MDTAISNGDFLKDSKGHPIQIGSVQELIQRALIRMSVKKGSFLYDKELGSELYKLKSSYKNEIQLKNIVLIKIKEALQPMKEVTVIDADINRSNNGDNLIINVLLETNNQIVETEVTI